LFSFFHADIPTFSRKFFLKARIRVFSQQISIIFLVFLIFNWCFYEFSIIYKQIVKNVES
jgi:hypothetical protein